MGPDGCDAVREAAETAKTKTPLDVTPGSQAPRAHPDLVGKAALAGTLTPESTREQSSAGLDRLSAEEIATFTRLNQAYKDKFGFPFVICARQNKKDSILAGFARRLDNSRAEEIAAALGEIAKISYLRLLDKVATEDQS